MAPPKKMDKSVALAVMGFKSTRTLESLMSKPDECREELDKALYKRTQEILHNANNEPSLPVPSPNMQRRKSGTASTLNVSSNGRRNSMRR